MVILGITDSFTSGAALVADGRLVAAVSEERLDRNKMSMGFPSRSIAEVLRVANLAPGDVDQVAVATTNLFWRPQAVPYNDYFRDKKGDFRDTFLSLGSHLSLFAGDLAPARRAYYGLKSRLTGARRRALPALLQQRFGIEAPVRFIDHHLCHAASAYFTSGMTDATVITQDGAGDGKCSRVYGVHDGRFRLLHSQDSYDSIGNYYSYVTHLCGFQAHKHEGKVTGLAAFGEPEYLDVLERFVASEGVDIRNTGRCFDRSAIYKLRKRLPADFSPANLSASIQVLLERVVARYCRHWVMRAGCPDLALAGGVFANVKLNQRIHELPAVHRLFVHPGMGDEGLGVGAALFLDCSLSGFRPQPVLPDVFLGGDFSDAAVCRALSDAGIDAHEPREGLATAVARLLAGGNVVARCAGRMEYGPRALGNRSILYQTTDPDVNHWLNQRLSRTEFMPFAPATLWEHRHACYRGIGGAEDSARFMTVTFDCTATMRGASPAVCHVDGTARPQLVRERDNPDYYAILREYHALTGIPSLINTSFNIHEEPIVNTPAEALQAFRQSRLDALVLGERLVLSPDLAARRHRPAASLAAGTRAVTMPAARDRDEKRPSELW